MAEGALLGPDPGPGDSSTQGLVGTDMESAGETAHKAVSVTLSQFCDVGLVKNGCFISKIKKKTHTLTIREFNSINE